MANVLRQQPLMKDQYNTGRAEMHFPLDSLCYLKYVELHAARTVSNCHIPPM